MKQGICLLLAIIIWLGVVFQLFIQPTLAEQIAVTAYIDNVEVAVPTEAPAYTELPGPGPSPSEVPALEPTSIPLAANCTLSVNYPKKVIRWCDLIEKYSAKRGLDPNLVAAVMWYESGGKPEVISKSGAVGLMQVMSSDGLSGQLYGEMFIGRPTVIALLDPETNIKWGTRILATKISAHGLREGLRLYYGDNPDGAAYAEKVISIWKQYGQGVKDLWRE